MSEENRVYDVEGLPALSSKDSFSFEISDLKRQYNYTLVNMNANKDPRPFHLLSTAIHTIPDPDWRAESLEKLDVLYDKVPYYTEKGILISTSGWGLITDWIQKTRGSITYNLVGEE